MTITILKKKLESLDFPEKDDILKIVKDMEETDKRRQKILHVLQEALRDLRLDIKYLQFDLEATRRERDLK